MWVGIMGGLLLIEYHFTGFRASLICYYIDRDTNKKVFNKEFQNGIRNNYKKKFREVICNWA